MKQIHLNILLPVALLVALAAAAAVFVIPMPFLGAPDPEQIATTTPGGTQPPPDEGANLPTIEPEDWTTLVDALEETRTPPAGGPVQDEIEVAGGEEGGDEPPPVPGAQAMLNGLQWTYVGNIIEPTRVVACVEMDGRQSWIVEGQTTSATAGLGPFDVNIKSVSRKEIVIEYKEATRSFPLKTTSTASNDFEIAT